MNKVPKVFQMGKPVDLFAMLEVRENRVVIQRKIFDKFSSKEPKSLLLMTMVIPGPIKANDILNDVFDEVLNKVLNVLKPENIIHQLKRDKETGLEFYLLSSISPREMKERMIKIEENHPLGRLFDLDVLLLNDANEIESTSRTQYNLPVRKCFLCQRPAKECGRSRRHSVAELQEEISNRLIDYFENG